MLLKYKKSIFISVLTLAILGGSIFYFIHKPKKSELQKQGVVGDYILNNDFSQKPIIPIKQNDNNYQLTDSLINGPTIAYANPPEGQGTQPKNELNIEFPKNYQEPINIKLDEQKIISIKNNQGDKYNSKLIKEEIPLIFQNQRVDSNNSLGKNMEISEKLRKISGLGEFKEEINKDVNKIDEELRADNSMQGVSYLRYQSKDKRVNTYYAYQKSEIQKTLKHWTIYEEPKKDNQQEQESYALSNAKIKLNPKGEVEVYYFGQQELQNEQVKAEVDPSLMARAQRTLQKELGEDILKTDRHKPDFVIPVPYYINNDQKRVDLNWEINQENNTITTKFKPNKDEYPVALDPTLEFTAPGQANSSDTISLGEINSNLGFSMAIGDFDDDGDDDLAVGASGGIGFIMGGGSPSPSMVYIFYNDGNISSSASGADEIIRSGFLDLYFGYILVAGDFDDDGDDDLAVSNFSMYYLMMGGFPIMPKISIFYNDGFYPDNSSEADVEISGTGSGFGVSLMGGDFNGDGKVDLAVSELDGSSSDGFVYIFYNDGSYPTSSGGADFTIAGNSSESLGIKIAAGDLNYDGDTDLIVSALTSENVYIFYNDGSMPTTSATADVTIGTEAAESYFGATLVCGDFNYDGRVDLAVGALGYTMAAGRVYIFNNDGSIPTLAGSADTIITGTTSFATFGAALTSGDINYDGRVDLIVGNVNDFFRGAEGSGSIFVFYNDGTIPNSSSSADITITEAEEGFLGSAMDMGDINDDGRDDLIAGGNTYLSNSGRVCVFYNDGSIPTTASGADITIVGEVSNGSFGTSLVSGDFNADGKIDLAIGSEGYSSNTGAVYIFYYDGDYPTEVDGANIIITGEDITDYFGSNMIAGDLNNDNRTDLIVGAYGYGSFTGRVYVFYNDGSIPTTAGSSDLIITGEGTGIRFGTSFGGGDLNTDGRWDLLVVSSDYATSTGRIYAFYNDGAIPINASLADIIITGEGVSNEFGNSMTSGDFNYDGRVDLAVGAYAYSGSTGRAYIFYNDGSFPSVAGNADVIITGGGINNLFGYSMTSGDFNADSRMDLAVSARNYDSGTGMVYIFNNDGSIPSSVSSADYTITGETDPYYVGESAKGYFFGNHLSMGDLNGDGRDDLAVGSTYETNYRGFVYVFYNDGSIPNLAANADIRVDGDYGSFGLTLIIDDLNADGKKDLGIANKDSNYGLGKVFILYFQKGQIGISENAIDDGEMDFFGGVPLSSGDYNDDGDVDLAVGCGISGGVVCNVYIFYNKGSISTKPYEADVLISGDEVDSYYYGSVLASGDVNYDGSDDLIVGDSYYLNEMGRVYIFYGDGTIPTLASNADVKIDGVVGGDNFGTAIITGDFNYDSRIDLVISSSYMSAYVYIFYNDGSIPTSSASADVSIAGDDYSGFGVALVGGDFNHDGRTDLATSCDQGISDGYGRVYIFYNDGVYPASYSGADITIVAESENDGFGRSLSAGDFNYDGRVDLATGAPGNGMSIGQVYIFNNDGSIPTLAANADVIIVGETGEVGFGYSICSGDFNYDSRVDLAITSSMSDFESMFTDNNFVYIFNNDGSIPTLAENADVIIAGKMGEFFGSSLVSGDFNNDSKVDLASGSIGFFENGHVYIFYNDGSIPTIYSSADTIISLENTGNKFASSLASGDFNNDSKLDLIVGAYGDDFSKGKIYLFYNDGSMPATADTADFEIAGENYNNLFGASIYSGDLNNDNQTDIIVGAKGYDNNTGRVYVFYNDGSYPTLAASADIKIDGQTDGDSFGYAITTGDIIGDSRVDLVVGSNGYITNTGRIYIFNNDGTISTTAAAADNIITGQNVDNYFGSSLIIGDFDYDMDNDLVVGAYGYNTNTGRVYIFNNDSSYPTLALDSDIKIDGESASNYFSSSFTKGDFNNDNRNDLIVGAYGYDSNSGRVYIFNNDGSIPVTAGSADDLITGENQDDFFSKALTVGDFNSDSKEDLAIGVVSNNLSLGKTYIFYNSGSLLGDATSANVIIPGEDMDLEFFMYSGLSIDSFGFSPVLVSGDFDGNKKIDICASLLRFGYFEGSFKIYTLDAEGTKPKSFQTKGGVNFKGRSLIK